MSGKTWKNVPGSVYGEIEIKFTSSGYYDPGKTNGLPEKCYPPEGDDERESESITITIGKTVLEITAGGSLREVFVALTGQFQSEIDDAEIDHSANEPDWDAISEMREEQRRERD